MSAPLTWPPTPTVTGYVDSSPCPRVEIVLSPMPATARTATVWRQTGGKRTVVRGALAMSVAGDAVITDYEAPLQQPVVYLCQTYDATGAPTGTTGISAPSNPVTLKEPRAWLQDPIDPSTSLPVALVRPTPDRGTVAVSRRASYATINHTQAVTVTEVFGSDFPVASGGMRQQPDSIPIEIRTTDPATSALRNLIAQAFPVLLRTGTRLAQLPPLAYLVLPTVTERTILFADAPVTIWTATAQAVRPNTSPVLVPPRTLNDLTDDAATLGGLGSKYASMLDLDRGILA